MVLKAKQVVTVLCGGLLMLLLGCDQDNKDSGLEFDLVGNFPTQAIPSSPFSGGGASTGSALPNSLSQALNEDSDLVGYNETVEQLENILSGADSSFVFSASSILICMSALIFWASLKLLFFSSCC